MTKQRLALITLAVALINPAPIGLLVQRVVGHHRLLGRRVPTLKTVGRIPLGRFQRGRHEILRDLRAEAEPEVRGHREIADRAERDLADAISGAMVAGGLRS